MLNIVVIDMKKRNQVSIIPEMIIMTALIIIAGLNLYFTGFFDIYNFNMFYQYIYVHGIEAVIAMFFLGLGIYCWYIFLININHKNDVLYLFNIENDICCFTNEKGKKFKYPNNGYLIDHFYDVERTHDLILSIYGISERVISITPPKVSYWLNFYSPMMNFEDILLLPIVYIILFIGFFSFLMSKGFDRIYGLIFMVVPLFLLIYDLVYKIKKRKKEIANEISMIKAFLSFKNIILALGLVFILGSFINIFMKCNGFISKLVFSPFLLCGIFSVSAGFGSIVGNDKLMKISEKMYIIVFLLFWFGIVSYCTFVSLRDGMHDIAAITILFWLFGFIAVYNFFIKK